MKIAINGFGRIGRLFLRQILDVSGVEVVAINDLGNLDNLSYLLKHDSVYREYKNEVLSDSVKGVLTVGGKEIKFFQEKDPSNLPWGALGVDLVIESTGAFESFEKSKVHLDAGAKKVLLTAPAKDADGFGKTVLVGINEGDIPNFNIISNGSCTTNSASSVIAVVLEKIGIEKAILSTVHAYTATQSIVDGSVKGDDYRRGRAAAQNIIPSTTGAAAAVTRVIPELSGKFDGIAVRVPTVVGSLTDITFISKRDTSVEEINSILKEASVSPRFKDILGVSEEQLVSSDIVGTSYAVVVDLKFTKVVGGNLVKILCWYDNEWGYVSTLIKQVEKIKGSF